MEKFLETEEDLLYVLTQIRATYSFRMIEPGFSFVEVNTQGKLADTITEVRIRGAI